MNTAQRNGEQLAPPAQAEAPAESIRNPSRTEFNTAVVHLYRAEVTKANEWRRRLDTTTNWAVVTTAAAISFAFSGTEPQRHVVILLISLLATFFLLLEARRYRHYDIWQTRVQLLETDFFAPMLWPHGPPADENWQELLARDLYHPRYHISFAEALGWRLRRNYVWIYTTLLLTWFTKISIHPDPLRSTDQLLQRAALGPIPGWLMILFGVVFNGGLIVIAFLTRNMHTAAGEIVPPEVTHRKVERPAVDKEND